MMASCIPTLSRRGSPVVLACGPTLLASFPILWRWSGSALLSLMMRDIHHRRASVATVSEGRWIKDRETANETCTHQLRDQESTWEVSRSTQGRRREKRAWACIPTKPPCREVSLFTLSCAARPVPGTWAAGVGCARDADAATSGMDSGRTAATWPWLDPSCSLVRMEQPGGARCSIVCALIHAPPLVGPENFTTKNIVPRFTISRCRIN